MKKLSVIVPVYRVEPYLAKCLDSILAQDVPDMELLVVDDGSPDQCYAIMEDYAQRYPAQVRIFEKTQRRPQRRAQLRPCPGRGRIHRLCGQRRLPRAGHVPGDA